MQIIATILIFVVAIENLYFLYLEIFLWQKPYGRKIFGLSKEEAKATATLAKNQGLYNGFLATGLIYSIFTTDVNVAYTMKIFFLICVIIAGIYGGIRVKAKPTIIQSIPAAIALLLVL